jgi:hypothetical protein
LWFETLIFVAKYHFLSPHRADIAGGTLQIGVAGGEDDFGHTSLPRPMPVKDGWGTFPLSSYYMQNGKGSLMRYQKCTKL